MTSGSRAHVATWLSTARASWISMGPWTRLLLLAGFAIHLSFWLSLPSGFLDGLFNDSTHRVAKGADFFQFYQAGSNLLKGESIYQYERIDAIPYGPRNKYPPLLAYTVGIAAQPLSVWQAYAVWVAVIEAAFIAMLILLNKLISFRVYPLALFFCLAYTPFYTDIYMGQTNTLMAMLIALLMYGFHANRRFVQIAAFAASLNVKLNTLLVATAFLDRSRYRTLLISGAVAALLFVPYFLFTPADAVFFVEYVFGSPLAYFYQAGNLGAYPLIQELAHTFTYDSGTIVSLQMFWSASVLALTALVQLRSRGTDPLDIMALWLCAFFLSFKFIWEHHLMMALPVLALEFSRNRKSTVSLIWALLAIPTFFVFIDVNVGPGYTQVQPYWGEGTSVAYHASKFVPFLLLYAAISFRITGRNLRLRNAVVPIALVAGVAFVFYTARTPSAKDACAAALRFDLNGQAAEAEAHFEQSISHDVPYVDAYLHYARFLRHKGKPGRARKMIARARQLAPEHRAFLKRGTR